MTLFKGNQLAKIDKDGNLIENEAAHVFEVVDLSQSLPEYGEKTEYYFFVKLRQVK